MLVIGVSWYPSNRRVLSSVVDELLFYALVYRVTSKVPGICYLRILPHFYNHRRLLSLVAALHGACLLVVGQRRSR